MEQGLAFTLLGPVRGWRDGVELNLGSPQQRGTIAVLLLRLGRPVAVNEIAAALWGESVPRAAPTTIRTYIHRLRRALDKAGSPSAVVLSRGGYMLALDEMCLDVNLFRRGIVDAAGAAERGELGLAAQRLRSALDLWKGEVFQGAALAEGEGGIVGAERAKLLLARTTAVEELATVELRQGRYSKVTEYLSMAVDIEPRRERLHELLMLALCGTGRRAEALLVYERLRQSLHNVGSVPCARLRELHERILRTDAELPPEESGGERRAVGTVRPAQLPADLPVFVGRQKELRAALAMRPGTGTSRETPTVSVISGMAGVGKTAFAIRWAHEVAGHFPDGQLYVDLRGFDADGTAVEPAEVVRRFLDALGVPAKDVPTGFDSQCALYRSLLAQRRCLIVLDNARDSSQVLPLLPGNPDCLVIVTTRTRLSGLVAAASAHTVSLDLLDKDEAKAFLAERLGDRRVATEPDAVDDIISSCARLPLALAVVCARASYQHDLELSAIANELRKTRGRLDAFTGTDRTQDVRSALSWSYRGLSGPAARLFRKLSLLPGKEIGLPAAASLAGVCPQQARAMLSELAAAHLITEHGPGHYGWHDLLHAYAGELFEAQDGPADRHAAPHRILVRYPHAAHRDSPASGIRITRRTRTA